MKRKKKVYKKCALLLPYLRQCTECPHKDCALRSKTDWNLEHAINDHQEEQKEFAELTEQ